jgi:hypothetical protein
MKTIYKVNGKKIKISPKGMLAEKYNLSESEKNQLRIMYLDRLEKEIEKSYDKARKLVEKIDFIGLSIGIPKGPFQEAWTLNKNYTRPLKVIYSKHNLYNFATGLYKFYSTLKRREEELTILYKERLFDACDLFSTDRSIVGKDNKEMKLLKEHQFYKNCEEEDHNNWACLLSEIAYYEESLAYYQDEGIIIKIDVWPEHVEDAWYFGARIFQHVPTGEYFWVYENLNGQPGNWNNGTEDRSWIDLENGTIQDWIDSVIKENPFIEYLS